MAFKDTWQDRIDGVDAADSSAVNEIAREVIRLGEKDGGYDVTVNSRAWFEENNPEIPEGYIAVVSEATELDGVVYENFSLKVGCGKPFKDTEYIANIRAGSGYGSIIQTSADYEKNNKLGGNGRWTVNEASGECSMALGKYNKASGKNSKVIGYDCLASGNKAIAIGAVVEAIGDNTVGLGALLKLYAHHAVAFNRNNTTYGYNSAVFGMHNIVGAENSNIPEDGTNCFVAGAQNRGRGMHNVLLGSYLTTLIDENTAMNGAAIFGTGNKPSADAILQIGNGRVNSEGIVEQSNAFAVNKDGSVEINGISFTPENLAYILMLGSAISGRKIDLGQRNTITSDTAYNYFSIGWDNSITGRGTFSAGHGNVDEGEANATFGTGNKLTSQHMHAAVFGKYNNPDEKFLFAVGGGTSDTDRKNAFAVNEDGSISLGKTKITESQLIELLALLDIVDGNEVKY